VAWAARCCAMPRSWFDFRFFIRVSNRIFHEFFVRESNRSTIERPLYMERWNTQLLLSQRKSCVCTVAWSCPRVQLFNDQLFLVKFISYSICAFASMGASSAQYARIGEQLTNARRDMWIFLVQGTIYHRLGTFLVAQLVKALRYKQEGRGFDSRWCHCFHWHNPSGSTMALGLTQPLTEKSTRNISGA